MYDCVLSQKGKSRVCESGTGNVQSSLVNLSVIIRIRCEGYDYGEMALILKKKDEKPHSIQFFKTTGFDSRTEYLQVFFDVRNQFFLSLKSIKWFVRTGGLLRNSNYFE